MSTRRHCLLLFFNLCRVATPLCLCQVYHFHCGYAPVKSEAECMWPENGHCRAGTKCYIKDNAKTKEIYASCCCNRTDTPVDMIERSSSDWSCFASYVDSPSETHGKTPFCDILCCRRQGRAEYDIVGLSS